MTVEEFKSKYVKGTPCDVYKVLCIMYEIPKETTFRKMKQYKLNEFKLYETYFAIFYGNDEKNFHIYYVNNTGNLNYITFVDREDYVQYFINESEYREQRIKEILNG